VLDTARHLGIAAAADELARGTPRVIDPTDADRFERAGKLTLRSPQTSGSAVGYITVIYLAGNPAGQ
jgi:hypothetical protein